MSAKIKVSKTVFKDWVWGDSGDVPDLEKLLEEAQKLGAQILIDQIKEDLSIVVSLLGKKPIIYCHLIGDFDEGITAETDLNDAMCFAIDFYGKADLRRLHKLVKQWDQKIAATLIGLDKRIAAAEAKTEEERDVAIKEALEKAF